MSEQMAKHIDIWYPGTTGARTTEQPTDIVIGLMSVRSASDLHVDFDMDRNGYRLQMFRALDDDSELEEVALVPAYLDKKGKRGPSVGRHVRVRIQDRIGTRVEPATVIDRGAMFASARLDQRSEVGTTVHFEIQSDAWEAI